MYNIITEFKRQLQFVSPHEQIIRIKNMIDSLDKAKAQNIDINKLLRVKKELKLIRHKILLDNQSR